MYFKRRQDRKRTKIALAIMCETRIINFMTQIPDEGTPETNIRSKKKTCKQHWALSKPFLNFTSTSTTTTIPA